MADTTDYRPSPTGWVRDQVEKIEAAGTTDAADIQGMSVVLLTMIGRKSGDTLKVPLMRVEHDGVWAAVASKGGAPQHPQWYYNLTAHPDITLQDGTETYDVRARLIDGDERAEWWERCVAAFPPYAEYQTKTDRQIPVFLLEKR
ncbi:nitroreductase family deazaflavin-dependent oxidoreductase [Cumulibacter manganitolerans]|uniref:nitroreductase family deazaflavin-dependent oxidoreductase n=1 Tax=Cumulibacter manganitolerans TaxID=1884992 RepID=UPI0012976483|nr:nitroreductase family deazaflavin-dependent oxidoreductase [Cumulibacter manganitolerans]